MSSIDSGIQLWALAPYTGRIAWHKVVYTDPLTTPNVTNLGINRRACEILSSSRGVLTHFVEIIGDAKEIKPGGKGTRAPEPRVVRGDTGYGLLNRLDESAGRFLRGSMSYAGFEADQIVAREDRLITLKEGALQQLELNENGYLATEASATAKKGKAFKTDWRIGVGMGNSKVKTYASSMAAGNRVAIGGNPWLQPPASSRFTTPTPANWCRKSTCRRRWPITVWR